MHLSHIPQNAVVRFSYSKIQCYLYLEPQIRLTSYCFKDVNDYMEHSFSDLDQRIKLKLLVQNHKFERSNNKV